MARLMRPRTINKPMQPQLVIIIDYKTMVAILCGGFAQPFAPRSSIARHFLNTECAEGQTLRTYSLDIFSPVPYHGLLMFCTYPPPLETPPPPLRGGTVTLAQKA